MASEQQRRNSSTPAAGVVAGELRQHAVTCGLLNHVPSHHFGQQVRVVSLSELAEQPLSSTGAGASNTATQND